MKKFILGLLSGAILFTPVSAYAWAQGKAYTNTIYNLSDEVDTVSVFDDADNKCYVVQGRVTESVYKTPGYGYAISCLKK